ncbi:50S ribosomal protein L27 [Candidatus Roizmanbacteria bacterium RIFCSPHIGHO2_02_FULL_40_13b]|uniref:Large ribosomal subunit protein bL27 n=1 Tax=Candidatus Roizmanbacteria bacterium RIFCSPHIGHO2_01_FULL_39_24 TaxID=1802032 RepID=A0A1F7GFE1_9BACT|nr:MAG: 50S ribosomal protein L27 [Candidatus Roizmanbacteria bacterium RIFCSPHIGHO2_01_FULL_39_24]OGK28048.1 MAG: 50S ribosomal protein L27 [Candidatus Roizmanbacteria bacterium RIFCSPHIGHO2_02_FULL_40_13b]OGK49557.1 MAG: 50S ribosomal protein L27 [Candidatus Roizmanbacteria bacterium RIFCSPLOWO2_01_FULL_40_32]OGK56418.1 MAG: 50S ribosomal protein L27 [Candidatus Roizmanbacteria bacterium RIFCSPLOWO2_02_FULL_39_8]
MAHTKSQKAAKGNRDSISKRLGVKLYGGQKVSVGNVIVRQRGMKFGPADGAKIGKDFTVYATQDGRVAFKKRAGKKYVGVTPHGV